MSDPPLAAAGRPRRAARPNAPGRLAPLEEVLLRYWGYDRFRPLQAEAMQAVLDDQDSVVVLPTGGGKSLCFQAPALVRPGLAVVVSPLISLMKDQVDALLACGVPAACVNSSLSPQERQAVAADIRGERIKLLYLSPERLTAERTLDFLSEIPLSFFAIDEAHCISDWGHDFRPEYRELRQLKQRFPGVAVHAYTATATQHVREDIARELGLVSPRVLVGSFDRPNLVYRVQRRTELLQQVRQTIDRHGDEPGIIYCIRRDDVESLSAQLNELGYNTLPYHAGLDDQVRHAHQDAFLSDRARIIVATVAFGMGIDKSDVRYVIHAAAPKSLEAYQQESGRAGRDGLEAECLLLYSGGDFRLWRSLHEKLSPEAAQIALKVLAGIEHFAATADCRHRAILRYFGQEPEEATCGACDVCLGEINPVADSLVLSQKILSCVLRLGENFGGDYTSQVLCGSKQKRIAEKGHDRLSTWGILREHDQRAIRDWIEQLVGQGYLAKEGEYRLLRVTPTGRELLRGQARPRLLETAAKPKRASRVEAHSWEGVDRGLFDSLRGVRRQLAESRGVPPFIILGDAALRDLARRRPSTLDGLLEVHGIGQRKQQDFGAELLAHLDSYCRTSGLSRDQDETTPASETRPPRAPGRADSTPLQQRTPADSRGHGADPENQAGESQKPGVAENRKSPPTTAARRRAAELFQQGTALADVSSELGRAPSTVLQYLVEYLSARAITDPAPWIDPPTWKQIQLASGGLGHDRLKPLYEHFGGTIDYDRLRIAQTCLKNLAMGDEQDRET